MKNWKFFGKKFQNSLNQTLSSHSWRHTCLLKNPQPKLNQLRFSSLKLPHCVTLRLATANFNKFDINFLLFLYPDSHLQSRSLCCYDCISLWFSRWCCLFIVTRNLFCCVFFFFVAFVKRKINKRERWRRQLWGTNGNKGD